MTGLEIVGYFSLGFIPTFAFMQFAWKKIRRGTGLAGRTKTIH